jgi:hypothetical protein
MIAVQFQLGGWSMLLLPQTIFQDRSPPSSLLEIEIEEDGYLPRHREGIMTVQSLIEWMLHYVAGLLSF